MTVDDSASASSTVHYDREGVRQALVALPQRPDGSGPKAAAREYVKGLQTPRLDDADYWTVERLHKLVEGLRPVLEAEGFVAFHPPICTDAIVERAQALPDDLNDLASDEAKRRGVPHTKRPSLWTADHWAAVDEVLSYYENIARRRAQNVELALTTAGVTDDEVASAVSTVTHGREGLVYRLTGPEATHLANWATAKAIEGDEAGELAPFAPDWRAEAKRLNLSAAELVAQVKQAAKDLQTEAPKAGSLKALDGWYDHRVVAAVLGTADDGANMVSEVTEALDKAESVVTAATEAAEVVVAEGERSDLTAAELAVEPAPTLTPMTPAPLLPCADANAADHANIIQRVERLEAMSAEALAKLDMILGYWPKAAQAPS